LEGTVSFPEGVDLDDLLGPFQHFGVNLGLDRIHGLLHRLGDPQNQVPIVHVAGTNGKGSVCAYLYRVLLEAGYRVGCYTSPHLVSWCERIQWQGQFITAAALRQVIQDTIAAIDPNLPPPTVFEIVTAAAWLYFAQHRAEIVVMEVGLGGRLDATNVKDQALVTIVTSISREHWQVLGNTLGKIAGEKAGILKPHCPVMVGPLPPEAQAVVTKQAKTLNCPITWVTPATVIPDPEIPDPEIPTPPISDRAISGSLISTLETSAPAPKPYLQHLQWNGQPYAIQLQGEIQRVNSALAIAALQCLQTQGWQISQTALQRGMANATWPGRLQWTTWNDRPLLVDGAHNPAAALALRHYLDRAAFRDPQAPITWIIGMLSTKDHSEIFQALLRPNDRLYLVPVPEPNSADPQDLAILAQGLSPCLCQVYGDLFDALAALDSHPSTDNSDGKENCSVLCGSLYLLGYFFQSFRPR
jgi:dihydrofolate synthase/folylpolyglutamate synthase